MLELGIDVDSYSDRFSNPDVGARAEYRSLVETVSKHRSCGIKGNELQIAQLAAKRCADAKFILKPDWDSFANIVKVIEEKIDKDKSPGLPFQPEHRTNGDVIKAYGVEGLARMVYEYDWTEYPVTRLFVKQQVHKKEKVDRGLNRLIASVGLIQQIMDHLIFDGLYVSHMECYPNIPIALGWSDKNGNVDKIWSTAPKLKKDEVYAGSDYTNNDIGQNEHQVEVFRQYCNLMVICADAAALERWKKKKDISIDREFGPGHILQLSNGLQLQQLIWGIEKSGSVNTLFYNSTTTYCSMIEARMQFETDAEILRAWVRSFGDDNLQAVKREGLKKMEENLYEQGYTLKEFEVSGTLIGMEWCGAEITRTVLNGKKFYGLIPMRFEKHMMELAQLSDDPVKLASSISSHKANYVLDKEKYNKLSTLLVSLIEEDSTLKCHWKSREEDLLLTFGEGVGG